MLFYRANRTGYIDRNRATGKKNFDGDQIFQKLTFFFKKNQTKLSTKKNIKDFFFCFQVTLFFAFSFKRAG